MNGAVRQKTSPPDKCNLKTNKLMKNILSLLLIIVCLAQCGAATAQGWQYQFEETLGPEFIAKYGYDFRGSDSTLTLYKNLNPNKLSSLYVQNAERVVIAEGVTSTENWITKDVDMSGRKMPAGRALPAGVYVVSTSAGSERVVVK